MRSSVTARNLCSCLLVSWLAAACTAAESPDPCAAADLLPEICEEIQSSVVGAKADAVPEVPGILVERVGNLTYFKVPLAYTVGSDHERLLDETLAKFSQEMGRLNREMIDRGIDLTGVLDHAASEEFTQNYLETLQNVVDTGVDDQMEDVLGETYGRPRELATWERYLVPQALIGYFSTKFSVNLGVGGGISATVMIVAQPWLSLAVDHTSAEPTVIETRHEVDLAVLGVPNVDVGFGAGGGIPLRIGAGAVFGPLDRPEDISGVGLGLSSSLSLPLIGGGQAKLITVLKHPPLFFALAGYNSGTSAGFEVHGNIQYIMNVSEFLSWLDSQDNQ